MSRSIGRFSACYRAGAYCVIQRRAVVRNHFARDGVIVTKLSINGQAYAVPSPGHTPLIEVLRGLGLKGTKLGCGNGECGACTVIINDNAVCACLMPVGRAFGQNIETIEGVGTPTRPHSLQRKLHESGAFQCGFCTPGMVMSLLALLRATPQPTEMQFRRAVQGNVCRCSGFKKLRDAVLEYSASTASAGDAC